MGHVDAGDFEILVQLADLKPHLHPQLGIQVAERLVEQEDLGLAHDAAAHGHPLALAARELPGLAVQQRAQLEDLCGISHPLVDLVLRHAAHLQPVSHVLVNRHVRVERVVLKDHGDVALGRLQPVHHPPVDGDLAGADLFQPRNHAQQGGLAAARRPEDDDELAVPDVATDAVNDFGLAELLGYISDADVCHGRLGVWVFRYLGVWVFGSETPALSRSYYSATEHNELN